MFSSGLQKISCRDLKFIFYMRTFFSVYRARNSGRVLGSKFTPSENLLAHGVLEKFKNYSLADCAHFDPAKANSALNLNITNWNALSTEELCRSAEVVTHEAHLRNLTLTDPRYEKLCIAVNQRSHELNDMQLADMIRLISLWPFADTAYEKNFITLWKSLDNQCLDRWKSWDVQKQLFFADLWFHTRLTRQSDYVFIVITKLATKPKSLSAQHVVQVLFYLNVLRTALAKVSIFPLEHRLLEVISDLTLEEIGVALMGFFKTQHCLHSCELMATVLFRLKQEANTVKDITLGPILKALRMSLKAELFDEISPALDILERQIDRLNLVTCVHISLLVTKSITFHRGSLTKVAQKLVDNISHARLKDIEKVIYPLTLVSLDPETSPCVFKTTINELQKPEREEELQMYPKTLVALLYFLSLRSTFIDSLTHRVLNEKFIRETYGKGKFNIGREILFLDTCVELQCLDYNGPRLQKETANYLSKRYSQFIPSEDGKKSKHTEYFFDVKNTLEALIGKTYTCKYLLPNHPRPDFVFQLDESGKSLPLPDYFNEIEHFTGIIRAPKEGRWIALVIGSRNMFARAAPIPTGETNAKLKQLKLIGYIPILVQHTDWPWVNTLHKIDYLQKLICSSLV